MNGPAKSMCTFCQGLEGHTHVWSGAAAAWHSDKQCRTWPTFQGPSLVQAIKDDYGQEILFKTSWVVLVQLSKYKIL